MKDHEVSTSTPSGRYEEEMDARDEEHRLRGKMYREALRWSIVNSVSRNVPSLAKMAQEKVAKIYRLGMLEELAMDVYEETDESEVLHLLDEAVFTAKGLLHPDPNEPTADDAIAMLNALRRMQLVELAVLQPVVVEVVRARFPSLTELAQEQVPLVDTPKVLRRILLQIPAPADEIAVRKVLNKLPGYSLRIESQTGGKSEKETNEM